MNILARPLILIIGALLCSSVALSQPALPGSRIKSAVEDEFSTDRVIALDDIEVNITEAGAVTLSGTVPTLLAKERAGNIALAVRGVQSVTNRIEVDTGESVESSELENRIRNALELNPAAESYEVGVQADDGGSVTLTGTVNSLAEKTLVMRIARAVKGVAEVTDDIVIFDSGLRRPVAQIKEEVEDLLRWDAYMDASFVEVSVGENGAVKLSGRVASAAEKRRAEAIAWTSGTTNVDASALRVDPDMLQRMAESSAVAPRSNEGVAAAVVNAIERDSAVVPEDLAIEVDDGMVTVRGTVRTLQESRQITGAARSVRGVQDVGNRIRVRPGEGVIGDEEITRRIVSALALDPVTNAYMIVVTSEDGRVELSGEVDSWYERGTADNVAAGVLGVKSIDNDIEVDNASDTLAYDPFVDAWAIRDYGWYTPDRATVRRDDMAIQREIENELWWSPFVSEGDIDVRVSGGTATLTGRVDSWAERRAATENALEGGAAVVVNELRVES